tara:strand:+ start:1239 stop:1415 length:177 start_codon:yes stop_codon:yes gene_type:complete
MYVCVYKIYIFDKNLYYAKKLDVDAGCWLYPTHVSPVQVQVQVTVPVTLLLLLTIVAL